MARKKKADLKAFDERRAKRASRFFELSDEELEAAYDDAIAAYIERMEFFDALPPILDAAKAVEIVADPEGHMVTRSEVDDWLSAIREHEAAALALEDITNERSRRIRERERIRVASLESADGLDVTLPARYPRRERTEPVGDFIIRREEFWDAVATYLGRSRGLGDRGIRVHQ